MSGRNSCENRISGRNSCAASDITDSMISSCEDGDIEDSEFTICPTSIHIGVTRLDPPKR